MEVDIALVFETFLKKSICRQIFTIFDPYLHPVGSFILLSFGKFGKFFDPSLKNATVLNGWSQMQWSLIMEVSTDL